MTTPPPQMPRALALILAAFPLPFMIFALSGGDDVLYRGTYLAWVIAANLGLIFAGHFGQRPSRAVIVIGLILTLNVTAAGFRSSLESGQIAFAPFLKILIFLNAIYVFDLLRPYGWRAVFAPMRPLALGLIAASLAHLILAPELRFGRHLYFGLHPNLGGELLVGALALLWLGGGRIVFAVAAALVLYGLSLLQARAALLAVLMMILLWVLWHPVTGRSLLALTVTATLVLLGLLAVALIGPLQEMLVARLGQFGEAVLRLDDPYRGIGTGLTGRVETWALAFEQLSARPLLGFGLDQAATTARGTAIHGGPLVILAEFGLIGLGLIWVILAGLARAVARDRALAVMLLACLFLFLFQPRAINLNLFPMVMWIGLLSWPVPRANRGG